MQGSVGRQNDTFQNIPQNTSGLWIADTIHRISSEAQELRAPVLAAGAHIRTK
jgi:hypothetical protein